MNREIESVLASAARNPAAALWELDTIDAETSLLDFIRLTWDILEPGRTFVEGWAVTAICEHLEAVTRGEIRNLLINVPPGCMKSLTTNVFWPAWEWGPKNMPTLRYVSASYAQELTIRDNRRCRNIIVNEQYQARWGDRFKLMSDQNAKTKFENDHTGFKIATSVGGLGTGERGDRFIIDDPHNIKDAESDAVRESAIQWFTEVVPTRINDAEKSVQLCIMQRVHERDVSGLIIAQELGWDHLMLPMEYEGDHPSLTKTTVDFHDPRTKDGELLWPERFSRRYLEEDLKPRLRAWGGEYAEAGQLQQRPSPRGGGDFKREWWQFIDSPPSNIRATVRGWDLAASKDRGAFTAGAKMSITHDGEIIIEDIVRAQRSALGVEKMIHACAEQDGPNCTVDLPQDPGQAGKAQKGHYLRMFHGYDIRSSPETGAKEDRARPLAAQAEGGNVFLVRGAWNDAFIAESSLFPNGTYKDQVDACSRAYARLIARKKKSLGGAPKVITG